VRRRYSFFIDDALYTGLKALKERDGIPESETIRRAISAYLQQRGVSLEGEKAERKRASTRRRS
jgi:hypothetical protein